MLKKQLEKLGLSKNEAKVYLAGLELGEASGGRIAGKAGIKRTTAYGLIKSLQEKGLFSAAKRKGSNVYIAEEPNKLETILEQKLKVAKSIIPELLSITNVIDKKPKIRFYEGKKVVSQIFNDVLDYPGQETVGWVSDLAFIQDYDRTYWEDCYMAKRKEKKIWQRIIASQSKHSEEFKKADKGNLRETRIDRSGREGIEVILVIYGKRKIAMFSTDELIGLSIESKRLHNTLKFIFEAHWRVLDR